MNIKSHSLNERGIAHLGLILLLLVIIGAGVFAFTRVNSAKDDKSATSTSASIKSDGNENEDAKDSAAIEDANNAAEDVPAVKTQEAPDVTQ